MGVGSGLIETLILFDVLPAVDHESLGDPPVLVREHLSPRQLLGAIPAHFGVELVAHEALVDLAAPGRQSLAETLSIVPTGKVQGAVQVVIVRLQFAEGEARCEKY